jgi:hypothetical protein
LLCKILRRHGFSCARNAISSLDVEDPAVAVSHRVGSRHV